MHKHREPIEGRQRVVCAAAALAFVGSGVFAFLSAQGAGASPRTTPGSVGVPTHKDQCKKGGYVNRTDDQGRRFANQGDCVSYVAT